MRLATRRTRIVPNKGHARFEEGGERRARALRQEHRHLAARAAGHLGRGDVTPHKLQQRRKRRRRAAATALASRGLVHERQMVSRAKAVLEEDRGAHAGELALGHDSHAIRQEVGLVHKVRGEENGPPGLVLADHLPPG